MNELITQYDFNDIPNGELSAWHMRNVFFEAFLEVAGFVGADENYTAKYAERKERCFAWGTLQAMCGGIAKDVENQVISEEREIFADFMIFFPDFFWAQNNKDLMASEFLLQILYFDKRYEWKSFLDSLSTNANKSLYQIADKTRQLTYNEIKRFLDIRLAEQMESKVVSEYIMQLPQYRMPWKRKSIRNKDVKLLIPESIKEKYAYDETIISSIASCVGDIIRKTNQDYCLINLPEDNDSCNIMWNDLTNAIAGLCGKVTRLGLDHVKERNIIFPILDGIPSEISRLMSEDKASLYKEIKTIVPNAIIDNDKADYMIHELFENKTFEILYFMNGLSGTGKEKLSIFREKLLSAIYFSILHEMSNKILHQEKTTELADRILNDKTIEISELWNIRPEIMTKHMTEEMSVLCNIGELKETTLIFDTREILRDEVAKYGKKKKAEKLSVEKKCWQLLPLDVPEIKTVKTRVKDNAFESKPGYVYRMLDKDGYTRYIGKAKNIDERMRQHFGNKGSNLKQEQYDAITNIVYAVFDTCTEADLIEKLLIGRYTPDFNTADTEIGDIGRFLNIKEEDIKWKYYNLPYLRIKIEKEKAGKPETIDSMHSAST